jgi:hypothetical protein
MATKTLWETVKFGSEGAREKGIDKVIYKCRHIKRWYEKNKDRTEKSVLFLNILDSVADYLEVANDCFGKHISILAMATRNQYELNVRITALIQDENELTLWQSEAITDGIQCLLACLSSAERPTKHTIAIQEEIDRLELLRKKWNLPVVKNAMPAGNLAKKVKMKEQHDSFFKLCSKMIHPSSFLVNRKEICTDIYFPILELQLQFYALSSISLVCETLQIPSKISKQYGPEIND